MKIRGVPLQLVRNSRTHRPLFRFDKDGIADLSGRRIDYKTMEKIKHKFEEVIEEDVQPVQQGFECMKCGFIAKSQSGLGSHVRNKH